MKPKKLVLVLLAVITPVLACNLPRQTGTSQNIPPDALRETLQAVSAGSPGETETSENIWTPVPFPPGLTPSPISSGPLETQPPDPNSYITQSGDTLDALTKRFEVDPTEIYSTVPLPLGGFIPAGTQVTIVDRIDNALPGGPLLPDNELVNSPTSAGFDLERFVQESGGYLSTYTEDVDGVILTGSQIVRKVAEETSTNPRLLLALLQFRSSWLTGSPQGEHALTNPLGFFVPGKPGLNQELSIAATHLGIGYYGWRSGNMTSIKFADGSTDRLDPRINAGTAGLQNLFAKLYNRSSWENALYGQGNFPELYQALFGDPWERSRQFGPLLPDNLSQPVLELPFTPGERWSLTGGPHPSWNTGSPPGALDFSPVTGEGVCAVSSAWARASAPGTVDRAADNMLALDLDQDGFEGTGWVLVYIHLADEGMAIPGISVSQDSPLGHPSCERGASTGKHVHIARKYNGEWLAADGPAPFVLSGWRAFSGVRNYGGGLEQDGRQVLANPGGSQTSTIVR